MTDDTVFQLAIEFLESENGSEVLPDRVSNRFIAACLKQTHKETMTVTELARSNDKRIIKLEQWQDWLKVGGFTSGGIALVAIIMELIN